MKLLTAGTGRPKTIAFRGGVVYIETHDEYFKLIKGRFLHSLAVFHPDTTLYHKAPLGRVTKMSHDYKICLKTYRAWLQSEKEWYATFELRPPRGYTVAESGSREWPTYVRSTIIDCMRIRRSLGLEG